MNEIVVSSHEIKDHDYKDVILDGLRKIKFKNIIKSGIYDSVGHLDYIKVYNEKQDLFSEQDNWYKKEVLGCLDLID